MPVKQIETLDCNNRQEWREWLNTHQDSKSEIWLVFRKRHTCIVTLSYNNSVEEAICFGWIDSLIRRLDDNRYARKFTPRKVGSKWSTLNRRRYAVLESRGLLAAAGLARPPTGKSRDAARPSTAELPSYIEETFKSDPLVWQNFQQLAPSYRRAYIGWINSAKRQGTKDKRLREALDLLAAGKKLGLK